MTTAEAITKAKRAIVAGDFATALADFKTADLSSLAPVAAARILTLMASCATALGQAEASSAYHRAALEKLDAAGLLAPETTTSEILRQALVLAVGAGDAARAKKYIRWLVEGLPSYAHTFKVSKVVDLQAWCRDRDIPVVVHDGPQDIIVPDGQGIGRSINYRCEPTWHADIPEAQIVSGWDFAVAPSGEVLTGASYTPVERAFPFMPHAYCESGRSIAHVWPDDVTRIDVDALFLSTPERHHYGHWLSEFLPRLRAWNGVDSAARKIVIPASLPRKHRDLLARFGVRDVDIVECELGRRFAFRSLRIVRGGRSDRINPRDTRFLSAALGPGPALERNAGRIFFLERDAGTRLPANVSELQAVLDAFGVIRVNPARLSLAEQMDLFKDARAIIGAYGTELYCLFNMPPGSTVIELHWDLSSATTYGPTCLFAGLHHHLILCAKATERGAAAYKKDGDIVVDCAKLRETLTALR
jgi:hypothetical protein